MPIQPDARALSMRRHGLQRTPQGQFKGHRRILIISAQYHFGGHDAHLPKIGGNGGDPIEDKWLPWGLIV